MHRLGAFELMSSVNLYDSEAIRILYYGAGWPTNIGNAFIDLGAMAVLRAAAPNAQIAFASEMPRWFFGRGNQTSLQKRFGQFFKPKSLKEISKPSVMDKALDVGSVTQCDLVVFAGMATLDREWSPTAIAVQYSRC